MQGRADERGADGKLLVKFLRTRNCRQGMLHGSVVQRVCRGGMKISGRGETCRLLALSSITHRAASQLIHAEVVCLNKHKSSVQGTYPNYWAPHV